MPGGDRTGPLGLGPMTGRGTGYCAGYSLPGYLNPVSGRGVGYGRGLGRGGSFGRGFGRGFGRAYPYDYLNQPVVPSQPASVSPKQEADILKAEAKAMQAEIEAINQRVKDLESGGSSEGNE